MSKEKKIKARLDLSDNLEIEGKWKEFWQLVYLPTVPSRGSFIEGPFATKELGLACMPTVGESHRRFLVKVRVIEAIAEEE